MRRRWPCQWQVMHASHSHSSQGWPHESSQPCTSIRAPTASAARPADAISDTPIVRTPGMAINIIAITKKPTMHWQMR